MDNFNLDSNTDFLKSMSPLFTYVLIFLGGLGLTLDLIWLLFKYLFSKHY